MKGYTIQNSIDLLEKAVEKIESTPAPTVDVDAEDVSYDNTSSGLTADDVQAAIDELASDISGIVSGINYSLTEQKIGTWLGEDLYQRTYQFDNTSGISGTSDITVAELDSSINVKNIQGIILSSSDHKANSLPYTGASGKTTIARVDADNKLVINCNNDSWGSTYTPIVITIQYTKTPAQSTRSKKK